MKYRLVQSLLVMTHLNYFIPCNVASHFIGCRLELGDHLVRTLIELLIYMHSYAKRL
jgi:hypothetical protein